MEKVPNKYALVVRIVCYILIPICILAIIQSGICLYVFAKEDAKVQISNYFETQQYADLYKESINNNVDACYSYVEGSGYQIDKSNRYGVTEAITEQGRIYYRNYLEDRNFKFLIIDNKTNTAFTNLKRTMKTDTTEKIIQELKSYTYYWNYSNGNIDTNLEKLTLENIKYEFPYTNLKENYDVTIYTGMQVPLEYYDSYYDAYLVYEIAIPVQKTALINLPLAFVIILICVILIGIYTGRKRGEKEVYLNWFDKLPLEIEATVLSIIFFITIFWSIELSSINNVFVAITIISLIGICYIVGMISYETFIRRIKSHTLLKNTLIYRLIKATARGIKNIYNNFNLAVKIVIAIIAFIVLVSIFINAGFIGFIFLLVMGILVFKYSFKRIKQFMKIKDTAKQLYEGNTQIRLQEDEYEGVLKELCIYLNDIAGGFTNAIEKNLKSERMKTELITNVSHDIKTPLTSIINYVDLLKKEKMPNKKAKEYLEVLEKKSQRLKRLTEDLVEASKASSGNIKLNMEKLDVKELIKQVSGEFEDKLKEKNLELILTLPEEEASVIADSRYLYRVIENMYSNIAKYALSDSRVYVDILSNNEKVEIQLKNISKDKLNISADELMERFVRGESSRNTEGSGLGLSIAQSLTQLQNGEFKIYLDGDLFKVTITFEKSK